MKKSLLIKSLIVVAIVGGVMLQSERVLGLAFTDETAFRLALGTVTVVDFENIASEGGQAGAVSLVGNEFPGITLTPGTGDGLFVGIPDATIPGSSDLTFFADNFFPTSGMAVFSPDLYNSPRAPNGTLVVDFSFSTAGVGAFFLDVGSAASSIEAFDGPGGSGISLGKVILQNEGDNSQAFAGIVADNIWSAVFVMGGGSDGVGLDDLSFGSATTPVPEPSTILLIGTALFGMFAFGRKKLSKK